MKKIVYLLFLLFAFLLRNDLAKAQADCSNPIIICGNSGTYNPSGVGNKLEQLACGGIEHNSVWFAFQAKANGKLNFVIRPYTLAGLPVALDIDWSLYQLPGSPNSSNCNNKTQLSCNFAGSSTVYGIPGATGLASPPFTASQLNPGIDVTAGTWYALHVDQFSNTTPTLISVQFTGNPETDYINSTAAIFDNRPNFTINTTNACVGSYSFTNNSTATSGISSYLWNFGDGSSSTLANPTKTFATTGVYYVSLQVTDSNGCVSRITKSIIYNNTPPILTAASILATASCSNSNSGTITVSTSGATTPGVSGGTAPYTYELVSPSPMVRPSQSSNVFTGLQPGGYFVKVTDACGKSAVSTIITITQVATNSTIGLGIQNTQSACGNTATGTATIFTNGTTPPYTLALVNSSPVTTAALPTVQRDPITATYYTTFTNLLPGVYTVEAVDGCGKLRRATFTVNVSTAPTATSVASPSCAGTATGTITVTATAATGLAANGSPGTFQYALINPSPILRPFQNSSVFENLLPGTYTSAVKDICGNIGTTTVTVATGTAPNFGTSFTTASCPNGSTGSIEVQLGATAGGGTPYTYELIAPSPVLRPLQSDNLFSNLPPGAYTVRLKDACGAGTISTITVAASSAPTFSTTVASSCSTSTCGALTINPGATSIGPYTFELISPGAAIRPAQGSNIANTFNSIFTGLNQGNYTIRMTDGCGVPVTGNASIGAPSALVFPTGSVAVASCATSSSGQLTIAQPTTGIGAYKYELISPSPVTRAPQYSRVFNELAAGNYTVRITDSCGTQVDNSATPITIGVATAPTLSVTNTASCTSSTGTITCLATTANQGGGTYQYALISPSPVTRVNQTSPLFTGLPAGAYTVQITDQCGLTGSVASTIAAAGAFTPAAGGSIVSCNGSGYLGQLIVTNPQNFTNGGPIPVGSGGGPYTYALYDATNTTLITGPQSSNIFSTVTPVAGSPSHTIRVTDGCGNTSTTTGTINVPTAITAATISATTPSCASSNTGVIKVTVQSGGGLPPLRYALIDAVTSSVVISNQTFTTFTNVPAKATGYLVRTTDACGNSVTSTTALLFPASVAPSASAVTTASCVSSSTGRIVVTPSSGSTFAGGTFSYALYDAANTVLIQASQASPVFENVAAATYTIRVTDVCGITGTVAATVSNTVNTLTVVGTATGTCTGANTGSIRTGTSGGSYPLSFSLVNQVTSAVVAGPQSDSIFSGLAAGTYIARVTDACGTVVNSANIILDNFVTPPTISTSLALDCGGTAIFSGYGAGGNGGPFTYALCSGSGCTSFGAYSAASTFDITSTNTYRISVKDRCGNAISSSDVVVTIPSKPIITSITKANACGPTAITVNYTNLPNTPYYSVDGGNFSNSIGTLTVGNHLIRISDYNAGTFGCSSDTMSVNVVNNVTPSISINTSSTSICIGSNVVFTATATNGGSSPIYQWKVNGTNAGTNSSTFSSSTFANNDIVTCSLTANNTCQTSANAVSSPIQLTVNSLPTISLGTIASVSNTATTFSIPYTATTGSPNQYSIAAGSPTAMPGFTTISNASLPSSPISVSIPASAANTYNFNLTVRNAAGCVSNSMPLTLTVTNPVGGIANNTISSAQTICSGVTAASLTGSTPTGGVGGFSYQWLSSTTSSTSGYAFATGTSNTINFSPGAITQSTWYRRIVYSGAAADTSSAIAITVNPIPTVNNFTAYQITCNGATAAAITPSGSSVPSTNYNWTHTNTAVGLAASGTGVIPSYTATNTTQNQISSIVTVTPVANGCSGTAKTYTIAVNPTPFANAVSDKILCNGSSAASVTITGGIAPSGYTWVNNTTSIGLAASGTGNIPAFTAVNSGISPVTATVTITPRVSITAVVCTGTPVTYTYTVNPTLGSNTIGSNQSINSGNTPSSLTGSTPSGGSGTYSYQWISSTTSSTSGFANASGSSTNKDYSPSSLTQTTYLRRIVSSGTCVDTSSAVTITVTIPLGAITNNTISSSQTICSGSTPSALTGSTPTGGTGVFTYTWLSSTTSANSGFGIASGSSNGIDYTPSALTQRTWFKRFVVSGSVSDSSTAIVITVNQVISGNTLTGGLEQICIGSNPIATDSLTASIPTGGNGSTYAYQWLSSTTSLTNGYAAISGANGRNYLPGSITQNTYFKRVVTSGVCNADTSTGWTVLALPKPSLTIGSISNVNTTATTFSIPFTASSGSPTQYSITAGSPTAMPGFTAVTNTTLPSSPISVTIPASAANTYNFNLTVRNASGCVSDVMPINLSISSLSPIANNTIGAAQTICSGSNPAVLTGSIPTGGTGSFTYTWLSSTTSANSGFGIASGTNNGVDYTPSALTQSTWYRRYIISGSASDTSAAVKITIGDNTKPMVYTRNVQLYLSASGTATLLASQVDSSSSDNCGIDTRVLSKSSFTCANIGANIVRLIVSDVAGNIDSANATVIVLDTIRPVVVTQNRTVYLNASGTATVSALQLNNGTSDACGVASLSASQTTFTCANVGTPVTITLTATDLNGNTNTGTATVTVLDTIKPVVATQNRTVYLNASGTATISALQLNNGTSDACGVASLSASQTTFTCANVGTPVTVTLTATDLNGNSKTGTATVTVLDTIRPVVNTQNRTVYLNATGTATLSALQLNNGTTDACGIASLSASQTTYTCANVGSPVTVTLTATDLNGNSNTGTATVTVMDTITPVVLTQNRTIYLNASGNAAVSAAQINNGSSDACGVASLSLSKTNFDCSNLGANTATLTVTDLNSNIKTGTAIVTVMDTIKPTVSPISGNVLYLNQTGTAPISVSMFNGGTADNCGVASVSISPSTIGCGDLGIKTITLSVTDNAGNINTATTTAVVLDPVAPVARPKARVSIYLSANGQAVINPGLLDSASSDNCTITSRILSQSVFNCSSIGANNVTFTVQDQSGNSHAANVIVTVIDTIKPVATVSNQNLYLNSNGSVTLTAAQVNNNSTDNCGISSVSISKTSFDCSNLGPNTITFTATDLNSNSNSVNVLVNVFDTIRPIIRPKSLVSVYLNASGTATLSALLADSASTDNCSLATRSLSQSTFSCANLGLNTVSLIGLDGTGNEGSKAFTVMVLDTVKPNLTTKPATVYVGTNGLAALSASQVILSNSDNCSSSLTATTNISSFTCANLGSNTVNVTVTDASNNFRTLSATVTVLDTIKPTIVTQNRTIYLNAGGTASLTAAQVNNGSSDNCNLSSISISKTSFSSVDLGLNTIVFTGTDNSNNSQTANVLVTVLDTVRPIVTTQNRTIYLNATGTATIAATQVNNGSTDNVGITGFLLSKTSFTCADLGVNQVVLTASDISNNSSTGTANITVLDTIKPVITAQNLTVYLNGIGQVSITPAQANNGSTDNCGINTLSLSKTTFTCNDRGANTVSLTASDVSNNSSSSNITVTVLDTIKPNIVVNNNLNLYLNASGTITLSTTQVNNGSTDNCGITSLSLSKTNFNGTNIGLNVVNFTATDASGNFSTVPVNVTIIDSIRPTVVTQNRTIYLNNLGTATITTSDINNGSSDNVGISNFSLSKTAFDCSNIGANTVVLTLTDASGNFASSQATVTVLDTIKPIVIAQNISVYLNSLGGVSITTAQVNNGSTDNCSIATMSLSKSNFTCADKGLNNVNFTVTDASNNNRIVNVVVNVIDTIKPVLITQNRTIYLNATGTATLTAAQVNNGSTDNCTISSISISKTNYTAADLGINNITFTATDNSSNSQSTNVIITVLDTTRPNVIVQNRTIYLNALGQASVTATQVNNGSSDNVGITNLVLSKTDFTCSDLGVNQVTLTASDFSNNSSTKNVLITVMDTIKPIANAQNLTVYLNAIGIGQISATQANISSTDNCSINGLSVSKTEFTCANLGNNNVNLTVSDASNNSSTVGFTVNVLDTIRPNVVVNNNLNLYLDASGNVSLSTSQVNNSSTDNCAIASLSLSKTSFNGTNLGLNIVTFTATDASNNITTTSINVNIIDTVRPILRAQNTTIYLGSNGVAFISAAEIDNGSTDNVGVTSLSISKTLFNCNETGTNFVEFTVGDVSGNKTSAIVTVTVLDTILPVVTSFPTDIVLGHCRADYQFITPSASDNCSDVRIKQTSGVVNGLKYPVGITTNTFTFTDRSGNVVTRSFTVRILPAYLPDTFPNIAVCSSAPIFSLTRGNANVTMTGSGVTMDGLSFDPTLSGPGNHPITLTFIDSMGCPTKANFFVTVYRSPDKPMVERMNADVLQVVQTFDFYQWIRNGVDIPGANQRAYTMTKTGIYSVRVGTNQGCTTESDLLGVGVSLGLNGQVKQALEFNVFPNPTVTTFTIDVINENGKDTEIEIFDGVGRLVYSEKLNGFTTNINSENWAGGTYYVKVKSDKKMGVKPLFIKK